MTLGASNTFSRAKRTKHWPIPKWAIYLATVTIVSGAALWYLGRLDPGPFANVAVLHDSQNPQALNIVILGDGFTAAADSMAAYQAAADQYTNRLKELTPFRAMTDAFNVYRVDVVSAEEGIDVPKMCGSYDYTNPPNASAPLAELQPWARNAEDRNTALSTTFCPPGWTKVYMVGSTDWPAIWNHANASGVFPHVVIVLINDWMYGATAWADAVLAPDGSGGVAFATVGRNPTGETNPITGGVLEPNWEPADQFPDVAVHETGHLGPFQLLDEYDGNSNPIPQAVLDEIDASPNLTSSDALPLKWDSLRTPGSSIPTACPDPFVPDPSLPDAAAAPGGKGYDAGVFHARCHCRMNTKMSATFCVVCRRQILDVLAMKSAPPIGAATTLRIIVDSFRLKTPGRGEYFIEFKVTHDGSSVLARWPKAPLTVVLNPSHTDEPGFSVVDMTVPPVFLSSTVDIAYTLFGRDSAGAIFVVDRQTATVQLPPQGRGVIEQFDVDSHRVTFGLVRR